MTAKTLAASVIAVVVVETEEAGSPAFQVTLLHQNQNATMMGYHRESADAYAAAEVLERLIDTGAGHRNWLKNGFDLKLIAPGCYAASKTINGFEFLVSDDNESLALPEEGPLTMAAYGPNGEDTGFFIKGATLSDILHGLPSWATALAANNA